MQDDLDMDEQRRGESRQPAPLARTSGTHVATALLRTAALWANATTDVTSGRRRDLLRDKTNLLLNFFEFVGKPPAAVTPEDVRAWQHQLEQDGLKPATVYAA